MLWPGLKKLGKELNLKRTDSELAGTVKNCFIKLYDGNNMKVLELYAPEINDDDKDTISEILNKNKVKKFEWIPKGIKITFSEYVVPYSIVKIKNILDELVVYIENKYPAQKPECQNCSKQKDCDVYSLGNTSVFICDDCYNEIEEKINSDNMEQQFVPGNYFSGFLGAMLFSIPGIFLTIIFFVFLHSLAAVSAVVYIFLGIKGYKKFKGKISPFGVCIISITGLLMIAVGVFVSYCLLIFKEIGEINFELLQYILSMPEIQRELIGNIAISYLVSAFYLVFQIIQMAKEWKVGTSFNKARLIDE